MPIWSAERTISCDAAAELLESQFSELRPINAVSFGSGWDNTAFLVNGEFVFRFPRRETSVALLEKETALLPQIAPELPLPIPHPIYFGKPSAAFDWPFAGYRLIPGETACRDNRTQAGVTRLSRARRSVCASLYSGRSSATRRDHRLGRAASK